MNEAWSRLQGFTHFAQPVWLWVGLVVALLLPVLYHLHDRRQRRMLAVFSLLHDRDEWGAEVSPVPLWLRRLCLACAALGACAALAQPLGAPQVLMESEHGIDILFAIDTSRSMLTQDVKPDRLTRARLAVEDLLDRLTGDAVGLVAFAGQAFLQAPLTTDYDAFRETLESLDTRTIPMGGTDLAAAISTAQQALAGRGDSAAVLVLITDGEDLDGEALDAARAAGKAGIRIYTVGVGTAAGDLIPLPGGAAGGDRFVRDSEGRFVHSSLDEPMLRQIAAATGGSYQPLGERGQGVVDLYQHTLGTLASHATTGRAVTQYAQLFQWPLGAAALLLLVEWLLRPVRLRRAMAPTARPQGRTRVVAPAALMLLWCAQRPGPAHAAQAPDGYGQGAQAYRGHDYAAAVRAYREALQTGDVGRQQNTYYNLGNALYRVGGTVESGDPQQAAENWRRSIAAYDTALQLRPDDADAKFNRGVVQKKLAELQRRQQQNQQNQGQNKQSQNNRQQNQGQGNPQGQPDQQGQQGHPDPQGRQGQSNGQQQNQQGQNQQSGQQNENPQNGSSQPGNPQNQQQAQQQRQTPQPGQQDSQVPETRPDSAPSSAARAAAAGQARQPDQMTREEAERLLDSVRGQERRLVTGAREGRLGSRRALPLKDW